MGELLTTGDVAKESGLTTMGIQAAVKRGDLAPIARTRSGINLFRAEDVQKFNQKRVSRKQRA
jgi:DNA-binding transcriptional MerR regulator